MTAEQGDMCAWARPALSGLEGGWAVLHVFTLETVQILQSSLRRRLLVIGGVIGGVRAGLVCVDIPVDIDGGAVFLTSPPAPVPAAFCRAMCCKRRQEQTSTAASRSLVETPTAH